MGNHYGESNIRLTWGNIFTGNPGLSHEDHGAFPDQSFPEKSIETRGGIPQRNNGKITIVALRQDPCRCVTGRDIIGESWEISEQSHFFMELAMGVSWVIGIPHSPSMGPWGFPVHSPTIQRAGGYPHGYMETSSYGPFSIAMLDHPAYPQPPSWTAWRARGWCPCLFPLQGSADVHHPFWWWLVIPWKRWKKNWMITIYHNQLGVHTTGTWIPCSRILADPIPRGFFRGLQKTLLRSQELGIYPSKPPPITSRFA